MSEQDSNKRETVGKIATDLKEKNTDLASAVDIEQEAHKDYAKYIYDCIADGKKVYPHSNFFVVVETKKEKLLDNVLRNFFFHRRSCPTPTFDQTVYHFTWKDDHIAFLWVIPSKDTCKLFKENILKIHPDERDLLKFILDFEDGTLLKLAKRLNNEQVDSIFIN